MRNRPFFVGAILAVLASATIAYGLVFWTPWFGARDDFGFADIYRDSGGSFESSTEYADGIRQLARLQPAEFQTTVEGLFKQLVKLSEAELYMLSSVGNDVCLSPLIDCQSVPGENVKPFVEKALAHKQTREAVSIAAGGLDTSRLSLVISFAAFFVSLGGFAIAALTYVRKKAA